jgi:hypothetical protein
MKSQFEHFRESSRALADRDLIMLELLFGSNPITDNELQALIAKRPEVYGRYASYLGKR